MERPNNIGPLSGGLIAALFSTSALAQSSTTWLFEPDKSDIKLRCNADGSGSLDFGRGDVFPAKCEQNGNTVRAASWPHQDLMRRGDPPVSRYVLTIDGDRFTGRWIPDDAPAFAFTGIRSGTAGKAASASASRDSNSSTAASSGTHRAETPSGDGSTNVASRPEKTYFYVCRVTSSDSKPVRNYISGVIPSTDSPGKPGPLERGFARFVSAKYGESFSESLCQWSATSAQASAFKQKEVDKWNNSSFRTGYDLKKYVETRWTGG